MKPLVSVVIPTYNRCKEVMECLDSVLKCNYKNLEVIVVDNASTDNTLECLKNLYTGDSKIKIIHLRYNKMAAGGRNAGIKVSRGKYLLFLDSDNIVDPLMIDFLVEEMENNKNLGLVGPLMLYEKDKKRIWFKGNKINYVTSKTSYLERGGYLEIKDFLN